MHLFELLGRHPRVQNNKTGSIDVWTDTCTENWLGQLLSSHTAVTVRCAGGYSLTHGLQAFHRAYQLIRQHGVGAPFPARSPVPHRAVLSRFSSNISLATRTQDPKPPSDHHLIIASHLIIAHISKTSRSLSITMLPPQLLVLPQHCPALSGTPVTPPCYK